MRQRQGPQPQVGRRVRYAPQNVLNCLNQLVHENLVTGLMLLPDDRLACIARYVPKSADPSSLPSRRPLCSASLYSS